MPADFETSGDFALMLEYLTATVGTETPTQLIVIARALRAIKWKLPLPEPLPADGRIYGYGECVAYRAVRGEEESSACGLPHARGLFGPLPRHPGIKTICFLHEAANVSPGYKLVATHGENGAVAFVQNDVVDETAVCNLIKNGYACLFVKP